MSDWQAKLRDKIIAHGDKKDILQYHPIVIDAVMETLDKLGLLIKPDFTQELRDKAVMYSVEERENQFDVSQFAKINYMDDGINDQIAESISFLAGAFPNILAGKDFNALIDAIVRAYKDSKPVILFVGGHVIKCGLGPILIDMMKRGIVTHIAMNGAAAIHDIEFAMYGHSSEWVKDLLPEGKWGMWEETGKVMHEGIANAYKRGLGMGDGLCIEVFNKYNITESSIISASIHTVGNLYDKHGITIHVAIGCDVIHQHPQACFEHIGATSGRDFYKLVKAVSGLNDGGVFINIGSAAMGPEIFSKALNLARNTGHEVKNFITANFDIVELPERLSRAKKNVIDRPHIGSDGKGYNFVGSHEIMLPLLWHGVMGRI